MCVGVGMGISFSEGKISGDDKQYGFYHDGNLWLKCTGNKRSDAERRSRKQGESCRIH